ncbi:DUF2628 domain-containing protein [Stenotrophomonas sp. MH1]|uniref:DUF2628 domain-containing protein n=1 Tax=Stenotrophomonas capsici TaxID=3110230 RepID=A0ABU5V349_9GAMM|nr:DUF2628 domain-containing protein [Stenotrophomonas sp. MH1]MEA5667756.1 DUF2628 domain-containing protein [Stenotrophomonas sp. MH1]
MEQNPYAATATPVSTPTGTQIDTLDVSDRWKQYFKGLQKYGGLEGQLFKAIPKGPERLAAAKEMAPPMSAFLLAFVFGFFYYLVKGMWKKGLVLALMTFMGLTVVVTVLYLIGGETLAGGARYLGGVAFGIMAPRDFYSFKVLGDKGWLPVRPF